MEQKYLKYKFKYLKEKNKYTQYNKHIGGMMANTGNVAEPKQESKELLDIADVFYKDD